uniref:General transcription factor IIIC, polypeptide 2, beta n=1 Tax=Amphilophus citrinellus TaxID=61819 RepID=A0A3Q0QZA7_AMPCI
TEIPLSIPAVGKGRKRKRFDSDAAEDEDFVPDHEEQEDADEMEDDEEEAADDSDLDSDFVKHRRNPPIYYVSNNNVSVCVWRKENKWINAVYECWSSHILKVCFIFIFSVNVTGRFESMPPHPERWDMMLYAGGPVWALEWCPTPDGALATQYMALSCHQQMDDFHYVDKTYTGTGLVQLWDVGKLEYKSKPVMVYGLAQDKGFIWHLKWCPAGGWELPSCARKAPFLPRLGLLAVATSTGVVTIYSMPHPDALRSSITLYQSKLEENILSCIFTFCTVLFPPSLSAGVVGLWDLTTNSALLRVREPDRSLSLLPYRCIPAHSNGVRALAFCPASRHLLVTAGDDRFVKRWDLRRLYDPITVQKRSVANEIHWPLNAPGVMMAQDNAIVSLSHTEWINCVATADSLGEVIFSLLPQISCAAPYVKRTIERRFVSSPFLLFICFFPMSWHYKWSPSGIRTLFSAVLPVHNANICSFRHDLSSDKKCFQLSFSFPQVRFNPNMSCHDWVASGGQTGLVRFNCIRTLTNTHLKKMIGESQAQFNALYSPQGQNEQLSTSTLHSSWETLQACRRTHWFCSWV